MKKLEISQMESLQGGKSSPCATCGQAIIMGGMLGGMFGGAGAIIGMGITALGPNCLDVTGSNHC